MKFPVVLLALFATSDALADERVVVAVADFDVTADRPALEPLGKGLAQMLVTDLSVSKTIRIVERARLREVLGEVDLQRSPYFDATSAAKLGRGIGAELIVTGQLTGHKNVLRIDVRAVDVETSEVVAATKVEGPTNEIFELQRSLATQVLKALGAELSPLARKRIGKRGTNRVEAVRLLGAALDAEDRGAKDELRTLLQAALSADPKFGEAQRRLDALEDRVGRLEKSGGLILSPSGWRDHLHNFRTHRANADLERATTSLVAALELEPRRAELWTAYHDLPASSRGSAVDRARLGPEAKEAVSAHLASDLNRLRAAPASKEHPAFRAVLIVDFVGRRMTSYTFTAARALHDALAYVLAPTNRRRVEPMLVDVEAFYSMARDLERDRVRGRDDPEPWAVQWMASEPDSRRKTWWVAKVALPERPASEIDVVFDRPQGRRDETFAFSVRGSGDWFSKRATKGRVRWGERIRVPNEDGYIRCSPMSRSPTGQGCVSTVLVDKPTIPPGAYHARISYTDASGTKVEWSNPQFWFYEFDLVEFRTGLWRHADARYKVNPIDEKIRERIDPAALKRGRFTMVARACGVTPLESIHYDVDFRLRRGRPISNSERKVWKQYLGRILKRGYSAAPHQRTDGCVNLPLPTLKPGKRNLCLVGRRKGGSVSEEPECFEVEVPVRYPQTGRKPRGKR